MKSKIGEFIIGPKFGALASKAVKAAIAEANDASLPKAHRNESHSVADNADNVENAVKSAKED
jgi:hypothetical protein